MKQEILGQILLISAFLLAGGIGAAWAQNEDCTTTLSDDDAGQKVCLRKGNKLCLRLNAQLATGFSWRVTKTDQEKLKLIGESSEKIGEDEVSKEIQVFVFEAIGKGQFDLEMSYSRVWEKDRPPTKKYRLRMMID